MSYYFKTIDYQFKNVVYNEGDIATDVFLVVSGNFTLKKKVKGKRVKGEVVILGIGEITGDDDEVYNTKSCICTSTSG